ncbi:MULTISPECIES: winged helix-turn-helix domain-containing protein [unclassified Haladaptatus]|uniref:winged helix-turn-helix domain-containing protein n=1 Tax=unclassified Haladaptatus TaxID=2622732 RepID=UPI0023E8501C|nr:MULTISPECIES: winged helix-turn-helix domain-containing protein [unclassified Haladaptatus]
MTTEDAADQRSAETGESAADPRTLSPDVAFKTIGNETRLAILDTLWGPKGTRAWTFTDLRKAVGMRDGSQFHFHLKKLVDGGFVEKDDGQYILRQAGARVICTVRTGYLTEHPEIDAFETTGECYACGSPLEAQYTDEMFFVACSACERLHARMWFPPNGLVGRTPEEALLAAEHSVRADIDLAVAGMCPVCNGTNERTVSRDISEVPIQSPVLDPERAGMVRAWYICPHCNAWVTASPGDSVIDHPAIVALYDDHGIDIRACPRWELPWTIDPSALDVVSADPLSVRLTVGIGGDGLVLTLDEAFEVVSVG